MALSPTAPAPSQLRSAPPPVDIPIPGVWDPKIGDEIDFVRVQAFDQERLTQYEGRWNFYNGAHWSAAWAERENFEDMPIVMNYARTFLDKHNTMLMGQAPKFRPDPRMSEADHSRVKWVNEVFERNGREALLWQLAQTAGISGDAFWYLALDQGNADIPYPHFRIQEIWPRYAFPIYGDGQRMIGFLALWPSRKDDMGRFEVDTSDLLGGNGFYWTEQFVMDIKDGRFKSKRANTLGFLPLIHFRNTGRSDSVFGASELDDFMHLNRALNEGTTDIADILGYHASPTTIIYGATLDTLQRGADRFYSGLPADSRVENLEMKSNLASSYEHTRDLFKHVMNMGSVPAHALGETLAMSNTSSAAITLLYWPMIEKRNLRRIFFGQGLKQTAVKLLRMGEILGMVESPSNEWGYETDLEWGDTVPRSRGMLLDELRTMSDLTITTRVRMLMELGYEKEEAEAIVAEADEEIFTLIEKDLFEISRSSDETSSLKTMLPAILDRIRSRRSSRLSRTAGPEMGSRSVEREASGAMR